MYVHQVPPPRTARVSHVRQQSGFAGVCTSPHAGCTSAPGFLPSVPPASGPRHCRADPAVLLSAVQPFVLRPVLAACPHLPVTSLPADGDAPC